MDVVYVYLGVGNCSCSRLHLAFDASAISTTKNGAHGSCEEVNAVASTYLKRNVDVQSNRVWQSMKNTPAASDPVH